MVATVKNVLYAPKLLTWVYLDGYYHKGMIHMWGDEWIYDLDMNHCTIYTNTVML